MVLMLLLGSWATYGVGRYVVRDGRAGLTRLRERMRDSVTSARTDRRAPRHRRVPVVAGAWLMALARADERWTRHLLDAASRGAAWGRFEGYERAREFQELRDLERAVDAEEARSRVAGETTLTDEYHALQQRYSDVRRRIQVHRTARGSHRHLEDGPRPRLVEGLLQFDLCATCVASSERCQGCVRRARIVEEFARRDHRAAGDWFAARRRAGREAAADMKRARSEGDELAWDEASERYVAAQRADWGSRPAPVPADAPPQPAVVPEPARPVAATSDLAALVPAPVHGHVVVSRPCSSDPQMMGGAPVTEFVSGEVVTLGAARDSLQQFVEWSREASAVVELLGASLGDLQLDAETLADIAEVAEAVELLATSAAKASAGLDARHALLAEAIANTPHRAKLEFYNPA